MSSANSELVFDGDTDVLGDNFTDDESDSEPEATPDGPPSRPQMDGSGSTYIRLRGFKEGDLTDSGKNELLRTLTTELLTKYDVPLEGADIVPEDVQVIEVHDDVDGGA